MIDIKYIRENPQFIKDNCKRRGSDADIDAILGEDGAKLIQSNPRYEMRFKIVEVYERIKNAIINY